ncbi:DNA repair and recombination protein rad54b [Balamuthia mandrillaris]
MRRSNAPSQRKRFVSPLVQRKDPGTSPPRNGEKKEEAEPAAPVAPKLQNATPSGPSGSGAKTKSSNGFKAPCVEKVIPVASEPTHQAPRFFRVMWYPLAKAKTKNKPKNDGILIIRDGNRATLKDMQDKEIGRTVSYSEKTLSELQNGNTLSFSGKEMEILEVLAADTYTSGAVFVEDSTTNVSAPRNPLATPQAKFKRHFNGRQAPKLPKQAKHSPDTEGAIVLYKPSTAADSCGRELVAVVVDPYLGNVLQPHQVEGVRFMYDCVMGNRGAGLGCILADEMGLGKTLQALTLIWTLLKQGPHGTPVTKKAIVVTPTSLTKNWRDEVVKWLGSARLVPITIGQADPENGTKLKTFYNSPHSPLLIISYDQFRINHEDIVTSTADKVDLVICDEGHRLKNSGAKITKALSSLSTRRRIIITGTPIQNDLDEFFAMVNFCNPGFMDYRKFKDVFVGPILTGRDSSATPEQKLESESRSKALMERTEQFIIRRTKALLQTMLPPRVEEIVFCRLSPLQAVLYKHFLRSNAVSAILRSEKSALALSCIMSLRKLCNHPELIYKYCEGQRNEENQNGFDKALELFPSDFNPEAYQKVHSGKVHAVDSLLHALKDTTSDRVVIVSNFTQTLNVLEKMCIHNKWNYLRMDGKTPNEARQKLIDLFNDQTSDYFVFLLSSKAGNVGFNLVGSNRMVLFDPDWNPANDQQAMGRVWRFGQKRQVWIYRLLSTGTIEEKIFQRQLAKEGLSEAVVDAGLAGNASRTRFSKEELKDIFSYCEDTICDTHEMFGCECMSNTQKSRSRVGKRKVAELSMETVALWNHKLDPATFLDPVLKQAGTDEHVGHVISFLFEKVSGEATDKGVSKERVAKSEACSSACVTKRRRIACKEEDEEEEEEEEEEEAEEEGEGEGEEIEEEDMEEEDRKGKRVV